MIVVGRKAAAKRPSERSHSHGPLPYTAGHEHHPPHRNRRAGGHLLDLRGLLLPARSHADHRYGRA
ncbi:hypothetical protein D3C75_1254960 [compost metagenome]